MNHTDLLRYPLAVQSVPTAVQAQKAQLPPVISNKLSVSSTIMSSELKGDDALLTALLILFGWRSVSALYVRTLAIFIK